MGVKVSRQRVTANRVGRRVASEPVQELQRGVGRWHQRIALEGRRRAREVELAVEILARDAGLDAMQLVHEPPDANVQVRVGRIETGQRETAASRSNASRAGPGNAISTASDAAASCSSD